MTWQTAIDALRNQQFRATDEEYEAPTEECRQRALAWMEARSFTDPIRWPAVIDTLANGGIEIRFFNGKELKLQVDFDNDGTAEWYEWRDNKIIATGQIALPEGEAGIGPPVGQQTAGGF